MPFDDSYHQLGELLRAARREHRLTLLQASQALHIRMRYLEALEEGRLEELPGIAYAKGYLQSYAGFLGLEREEILRRFEQVEILLVRKSFYLPQALRKEKKPSGILIWGGLALAAMSYILWLALAPSTPAFMRNPAIAMVKPYEKPVESRPLSAEQLAKVACLQTREWLYPPCTMAAAQGFNLLPLQRQLKSITDDPTWNWRFDPDDNE